MVSRVSMVSFMMVIINKVFYIAVLSYKVYA